MHVKDMVFCGDLEDDRWKWGRNLFIWEDELV
jgi:hypothetical protein